MTLPDIPILGQQRELSPDEHALIISQGLTQLHVLCPCGEAITTDGRELLGVEVIPLGLGRTHAIYVTQTYCGPDCARYLGALVSGLPYIAETPAGELSGHTRVRASRQMPTITWF